MATKNQHYVPRVYIKSWETTVYSKKEPQKAFTGVYYYDKADLSLGDGRNKESILSSNHTYTVDFRYDFILQSCREIRIEFTEKIKTILSQRRAKAYYKGNLLTNRNAIFRYLPYLESWDFYHLDGTTASKKSIINEIRGSRSYCLEDRFSSYVEAQWGDILKQFLLSFPDVDGTGQIELHLQKTQTIVDMLNMLALMMCRNPSFDLLGIFSWLKDDILAPAFSSCGDATMADIFMRGCWLTEIYRGLYSENGFVDTFLSTALSNLGIVVYRVANKNEGTFITSDNPVVYHKLLVETTNHNGIYFPLTPRYLIFLGKRSNAGIDDVLFRTVHNRDLRNINRILLNGAESGIVSQERRLGYIL